MGDLDAEMRAWEKMRAAILKARLDPTDENHDAVHRAGDAMVEEMERNRNTSPRRRPAA